MFVSLKIELVIFSTKVTCAYLLQKQQEEVIKIKHLHCQIEVQRVLM